VLAGDLAFGIEEDDPRERVAADVGEQILVLASLDVRRDVDERDQLAGEFPERGLAEGAALNPVTGASW